MHAKDGVPRPLAVPDGLFKQFVGGDRGDAVDGVNWRGGRRFPVRTSVSRRAA